MTLEDTLVVEGLMLKVQAIQARLDRNEELRNDDVKLKAELELVNALILSYYTKP